MAEPVEVGGNCTLDQFIAALEAGTFQPGWLAREAGREAYFARLREGEPPSPGGVPTLEYLEGRP